MFKPYKSCCIIWKLKILEKEIMHSITPWLIRAKTRKIKWGHWRVFKQAHLKKPRMIPVWPYDRYVSSEFLPYPLHWGTTALNFFKSYQGKKINCAQDETKRGWGKLPEVSALKSGSVGLEVWNFHWFIFHFLVVFDIFLQCKGIQT